MQVDGKEIYLSSPKITEKQAVSLASMVLSKAKDVPLKDGLPKELHSLQARVKYIQQFVLVPVR